VKQAKSQDVVGGRAQLKPHVGPLSQAGPEWIDHDQLGPGFETAREVFAQHAFFIGGRRVAAPKEHALGGRGQIGHREKSAGDRGRLFAGHVADVLSARDVRAVEKVRQAQQHEELRALGSPLGKTHAFRPVAFHG
jgi:hypothetical protein